MNFNVFKRNKDKVIQLCWLFGLLALMCVAFYLFTLESSDYTKKTCESRLYEITNQNAAEVNSQLAGYLSIVERAAILFANYDDLTSSAVLSDLQEIEKKTPFEPMALTDTKGNSMRCDGSIKNISQRDYYQKAMMGKSGIDNILEKTYSTEMYFIFYAPIEKNGKICGMISAVLESKQLAKTANITTFNGYGYALLVDSQGSVILSQNNNGSIYNGKNWNFFENSSFEDNEAAIDIKATMKKDSNGEIVAFHNQKGNRIMLYVPIGVNNWYLIQVIPKDVIYEYAKPINEIALKLMIELLLISLTGAGIIVYYGRKYREQAVKNNKELSIANERFAIAMESSEKNIFEYDIKNNTITHITKMNELFGLPKVLNDPIETLAKKIVYKDDEEIFYKAYKAMRNGEKNYITEFRCFTVQGKKIWLRLTFTNIFDNKNRPAKAVGILDNITAEKEAQERYDNERQFRSTIMPDLLSTITVNLTKDLIVERFYKDRIDESKIPYSCFIEENLNRDIYNDDRDSVRKSVLPQNLLAAYYNGKKEIIVEFRYMKDNKITWAKNLTHIMKNPDTNEIICYIYTHNINEQKEKEIQLQKRVCQDPLTGLYNRSAAEAFVNIALQSQAEGVFMMLDIDDFKNVNDTLGHNIGDELLIDVGAKLKSVLREQDLVARMGGDEFAIFMPGNYTLEIIRRKTVKVLEEIRGLNENYEVRISCSIGIAIAPQNGISFSILYDNADKALYNSKRLGKNQFTIFNN
ncbi:MAG: diguanylate cyclase [Clostridiales bacterium]